MRFSLKRGSTSSAPKVPYDLPRADLKVRTTTGFWVLGSRTIVFASAFVWLWGSVALWARRLDSRLGIVLPSWSPPLGIVLLVCGGVLALTCIGLFVVRGRGAPAAFDPPRAFLADR